MQSVGPWGYWILGLAALIEYVFPPFPGDSITLLGGLYVARDQRPWPLVLFAVTLGSVLGAALDYWVGGRLARRLEREPDHKSRLGAQLPRLQRLQAQMKRRGVLLLAVNRFLPGVRALIFVAAGAARMPPTVVLGWGAVSALLFNGGVLAVGMLVGGNAERLAELLASYQRVVWTLLAVAGAAVLVRALSLRQSR